MKLLRAIAIVLAALAAAHCVVAVRGGAKLSWDEWKQRYQRTYTPGEDARRALVYAENMRTAAALEARNPLASFGESPYADLTAAEFKTYHNGDDYFKADAQRRKVAPRPDASAAGLKAPAVQKIDWRTKGAVTYVKNQAQCGSCWSFSATGNIEGQWFLAGNKLVALSEQELVSCDTTDSGCQGGLMDNAFGWLINNRGGWITGENDYPYTSGAGTVAACSLAGKPNRAQIASFHDVETNEPAMAAFCAARGPVSIGVDATSFQTYSSGILTDCISQQVDHGVLIVGFDLTYSTPYWIVKNSWGGSWGESGYIRVAYGSDQCLITSGPTSSKAGSSPAPPAPPAPSGSGSGSQPTAAPSNSGSGSTNPPPPTPPTPSNGSFTQNVCPTSGCNSGCQAHSFPTSTCLAMSGGGSALVTCGAGNLNLQVFSSSDCSGASQTEQQPLDQCLADTSGTYIYNTCSGGSNSGSGSTNPPPPPPPPSNSGSSSSGFDEASERHVLRTLRHRKH